MHNNSKDEEFHRRLSSLSHGSWSPARVGFWGLLSFFVLQQVSLTVLFGLPKNSSAWVASLVSPLTHVFMYAFYVAMAYGIGLVATGRHRDLLVLIDQPCPWRWPAATLQSLAFVILLAITPTFLAQTPSIDGWDKQTLRWLGLVIVILALSLRSLLPFRVWWQLARQQWVLVCSGIVIGMLCYSVVQGFQTLWQPMASATLHLSAALLGLFFHDAVVDVGKKLIGTDLFRVHIGWDCSGYEGVGLVLAFGSLFLYLFRHRFVFPRALVLLPIGAVAIWLLNCVRIVILVAIGHGLSPAIATEGFHSNAGLLFFVLVCGVMMWLSQRWRWVLVVENEPSITRLRDIGAAALILPFTALMLMTLLTPAFSAGFDWLYPLRVLLVAYVLAWCWTSYDLRGWRPHQLSIVGGVLVALLWIVVYPRDAEADAVFQQRLFSAQRDDLALTWLFFRALGSSLTVPVAEELFFRGYLMARLQGVQSNRLATVLSWHGASIVGTSILFGLLHDAWIAGSLAGLVFAAVRVRCGNVLDAIAAHAVANTGVTLWVLSTGQYTLW